MLPEDLNIREYNKFDEYNNVKSSIRNGDNELKVNPDGSLGDSLPTTGNNPSEVITETLVGSVLTTVIQKTINATVYTKTIVENYTTGVTTETAWT